MNGVSAKTTINHMQRTCSSLIELETYVTGYEGESRLNWLFDCGGL